LTLPELIRLRDRLVAERARTQLELSVITPKHEHTPSVESELRMINYEISRRMNNR
jgi:hypothetical protein